MAITISIGIQKGGVGKTTTTSISAYLLSENARVLVVDLDPQGNSTFFLTQESVYANSGKTVYEALLSRDAKPYIRRLTDTLHLLPSEDHLVEFEEQSYFALKETLYDLRDQYDYILIDQPPQIGRLARNGLVASDYAVAVLQSDPLCLEALERYIDVLLSMKKNHNPRLVLAGILPTMVDRRTTMDSFVIEQAREEYEDLVFNTIIKRTVRLKEFSYLGITDESLKDKAALRPYRDFVRELIKRVSEEVEVG